jgi:hypothetical protein
MKWGSGRVSTTEAPEKAHFLPKEKCMLRREGDPENTSSSDRRQEYVLTRDPQTKRPKEVYF